MPKLRVQQRPDQRVYRAMLRDPLVAGDQVGFVEPEEDREKRAGKNHQTVSVIIFGGAVVVGTGEAGDEVYESRALYLEAQSCILHNQKECERCGEEVYESRALYLEAQS